MPRIDLTINTNYVASWGPKEGIRELLQNGIDSDSMGNPLEVTFRPKTQTLSIRNHGVVLKRENLLLGVTTKAGKENQIGQYGEGLKIGILALIRAGFRVGIRTGEETWTPKIANSAVFGKPVLSFDIRGGNNYVEEIEVKVKGVSEELYEKVRRNTLKIRESYPLAYHTTYGAVLRDESEKGRIYSQGLFVGEIPEFTFGYDLPNLPLDRDRRVVDSYQARNYATYALNNAVQRGKMSAAELFEMAESGAEELRNMMGFNITGDTLVDEFQAKYGEDCLPVQSMEQALKLKHFGKKGVIVPQELKCVLETKLGTFKDNVKKLGGKIVRYFQPEEIAEHIDKLQLVCEAIGLDWGNLTVVEYAAENQLGQYNDGQISVSHKILDDSVVLCATLIHELAHNMGGDGEREHTREIEEIAGRALVAALGI